jgi:hypothetical protein
MSEIDHARVAALVHAGLNGSTNADCGKALEDLVDRFLGTAHMRGIPGR